ncbi:T9SS type A sorting domain-containing protein [Pontibacter sp. H249]|uniref:T9SS type A sorting domain-containing protein n=1 Tax=Pontibacter sp. H249 TaxID=3133420 RepID=UPI0030C4006A
MKTFTILLLWMLLLSTKSYAASNLITELFRSTRTVGNVQAFTLVDPETGNDIRLLKANDTITAGTPYNIRINTEGRVRSVVIVSTSEKGRQIRFDNTSPYTVGGDRKGNYANWLPKTGSYTITATPYRYIIPIGKRGQQLSIQLTVLPEAIPETKFILVDATTDEDIMELSDGAILNLDSLPSKQLNIRADVGWQLAESVKFGLNENENFRIEDEFPYALHGDTDGDYNAWTPDTGTYTLTATAYAADNAIGAAGPSRTITFTVEETPAEPAYTSYVELNNLVVVYKNTNGGTIPDSYPDSLAKALEETNKFYWRQSYMTFNLKWTVYVIEEELERVHENGYVFPHEVDADLRARGFPVDSFDAVGAVVRGGGAYAWGTNNILGRGSYFQVPWWEEHYLFSWFFVHEFHHILDAMFVSSGHPEYPHNHPGAARAMGEYVPRSGGNWDLNREIVLNWDRQDWFDLSNNGNWGKIRTALDADTDTIPDNEPNVPFDEARYGSSSARVDTDGDGLTDLQEAMIGIFTPSNPLSADTDGDGLPDATDPEPLYPIKTTVPKVSNLSIDQSITEWPVAGNYFFNRNPADSASFHLAYSENNLYLGARIPGNFNEVEILIDGNNDGMFHGKDNIWLVFNNSGIVSIRLFDAASVPPGDYQDFIITELSQTGFELNNRLSPTQVSFQLQIPKLTEYGLDLTEGEQIGIFMHINGYALLLEHDDLLTVTLGSSEIKPMTTIAGIQNSVADAKQFVYPNPASSNIAIDFNTEDIAGNWRILDSRGTEYMRSNITTTGPATMNIEALPAGLYLLHVESAAGKKVFRFIKN